MTGTAGSAYLPPMTDTLPEALATSLPDLPRDTTQDGPKVRLYLVDGSGYIILAPTTPCRPSRASRTACPWGAVAGFCNMLWKLLVDMKASRMRPTIWRWCSIQFREDLPQRALRPVQGPPPTAAGGPDPAVPLVREATRAFGVPSLELPGYEADDLIAAYAAKVRDAGGEVVIISSDKDLMQLWATASSCSTP